MWLLDLVRGLLRLLSFAWNCFPSGKVLMSPSKEDVKSDVCVPLVLFWSHFLEIRCTRLYQHILQRLIKLLD